MGKIECINGLEYHKVMFRNEIADLVRHALKTRVDYIHSIEINIEGGFIINYMCDYNIRSYYDRYNMVARRIEEFYKIEQRADKLKELGI